MDFREMTRCIAGIAFFASLMDSLISDTSRGFGFRTLAGLAIALSILEAVQRGLSR